MTAESTPALASVVIPTFSRKGSLGTVLEPVLGDPATGEVIVVVDGCRDGSFELLTEWSRQDHRLKPLFQENAGEARARQAGLEAATGDVVVFLDDDVIITPGVITGHMAHHADGQRKLVLGYMPTRVDLPRRPGQVPTMLYAQDYERMCIDYEAHPDHILLHLWAGNLSLRRRDALEIGLVPSVRFGYHADMQFGLACREAGIHAVFDRELRSTHIHSRSLRAFGRECRLSGQGRAYLCDMFPTLAPEIDPSASWPRALVPLLRVVSSRWVRPVSARMAMGIAGAAGRMHLWPAETAAARALRQIEANYGFTQAAAV
ncbi:MAG: glycosyltransferase [Acidimicrobiales bacterium]|jgi:glycosyltransferase involved in cell wall biosynthesis